MMKVMVVGLGSMGKRRVRLIKQFDSSIEIVGVDSREDRRREASSLYGIVTYHNLDEAVKNGIQAAFVCTSPLSHEGIITKCLEEGLDVFTEINIVSDGYDKNIKLAKKNNKVLFLSSTFLYREEIKEIKNITSKCSSTLSYSYHVGQYLPDWHPWEAYTDFFVGDKRTNACREIFAIELPWMISVFGKIESVQVQKKKSTCLTIDYPDTYMVIFRHETGAIGTMNVDVVSRKPVRNLEVFGEDLYLSWNGEANGLYVYDLVKKEDVQIICYNEPTQLDNYASFVVENEYLDEIKTFFEVIDGKQCAEYGFEEDKITLDWIDKIEANEE